MQPRSRRHRISHGVLAVALASSAGHIQAQSAPAPDSEAGPTQAASADSAADIERLRAEDNAAYQAGDYARAIRASKQVLALVRSLHGEHSADYARALNDHAMNIDAAGRSAEAEPLYRRALALHTDMLGELHPDTFNILSSLARNLSDQGRLAQLEQCFWKRHFCSMTCTHRRECYHYIFGFG